MVKVVSQTEGNVLKKQIETLRKNNKEQKQKITLLTNALKKLLPDIDKLKNPRCSKCKSWNVIKRGTRKSINRGNIQRYGCLDCDWKFTTKNIEYGMRHNQDTINKVLSLRKEGKTYSEIAEEIGNVMSRQNVLRILRKFQPPKKEIEITRKQKGQFGEYDRKFKIKI